MKNKTDYRKRIAECSSFPALFSGNSDSIGFSLSTIINIIVGIAENIISYVGLLAVVMIVIAGIILIVNGGNEGSRDRARRIVIYTIVGILVILLASAIVRFVLGSVTS